MQVLGIAVVAGCALAGGVFGAYGLQRHTGTERWRIPVASSAQALDTTATVAFISTNSVRLVAPSALGAKLADLSVEIETGTTPVEHSWARVETDWVYLAYPPELTMSQLEHTISALPGRCVGLLVIGSSGLEQVPVKRCCSPWRCAPARPATAFTTDPAPVALSIRMDHRRIATALSTESMTMDFDPESERDAVAANLVARKQTFELQGRSDIEFGVAPQVTIQDFLAVRDLAVAAGFDQVQLVGYESVSFR